MGKIVQFFKESYAELRKVVWPSREEVVSSVGVVIVSTVIIAVVLGLVDFLLVAGVRKIFG
jgi:preprotein translocase subunit SecE